VSPRAAITIDVDSLRFYREIHGLPPLGEAEDDPIYTIAMPRFWELITEAGIPATLFLIGQDAPRYRSSFEAAKATGSEIANHSFSHDYRLTKRSAESIADDLSRADDVLRPLSPSGRIAGFRAPGYNTSKTVMKVVADLGYVYDSSLLPSPLYFLARLLAITGYAILGRPSRSLIGNFFAYAGTLLPHTIGTLVEIPMACEPWTRVPIFGTSWVLASDAMRRFSLKSALTRLPVFNFEMHAIDLLDATDRGVGADLAAAQRDLKVPVADKMRAFRGLFSELKTSATMSTLEAIARP
jgi:peptidoglycan/xylan/chitin deacetylase (PgdA/CDA1 family)